MASTVSQPCRLGQAAVCPCARVCYGEIAAVMQTEEIKVTSRSNPSQRIIALGIVFAFLYFASSIVITLLLAVLMAYFLDPVVGFLERIHIPRALGALLVLLAVTSDRGRVGLSGGRSRGPVYRRLAAVQRASLRQVTTEFDRRLSTVEKQVEAIAPAAEKGRLAPRATEPPPDSRLAVSRRRFVVFVSAGRDVRAVPGVLHAGRQTANLESHDGAISRRASGARSGGARSS